MAASFHVVIERPRDARPGAAAALADAMAARYGIPVAQLRERLAAGALRVKSNVDLPTAETFARDLESLGAVCAILDATSGAPLRRAAPAAAAPAKPALPQYASGLAAAATPSAQDLGALGAGSGELSLATLDGDDERPAEGSDSMLAASFGPPVPVAPEAPAAPSADPFAPPDAESEPVLDLDVDPATIRKPGRLADSPAPAPASRAATPAPEPPASPRRAGLAGLVADVRVRLAVGVALAILIGFVPAHLVAAAREDTAYAQVDREIEARYRSVLTEADWDALDAMLARQLERKKEQRRSIALASFLIWGVVGAGVAFVWFRKLDWDALVERLDG